jgi:hypothetical protein
MAGNSFPRRGRLVIFQGQGTHGIQEGPLQQTGADERHAEHEKEEAHRYRSVEPDAADVVKDILNHMPNFGFG